MYLKINNENNVLLLGQVDNEKYVSKVHYEKNVRNVHH